MLPSRTWRIAHRGARDEAPENTRAAFERALQYPIDGIELDVQMSADGVVVIYHDATLKRVSGGRRRVSEMTHAQLAVLDWGRWFHADFSREPLLTLEQMLALFARRTRLLIEIKSTPTENRSGHTERLTREVVRLLGQMPPTVDPAHIYVLSFDPQALWLAHQLAPHWRCVLNVPEYAPNQVMGLTQAEIEFLWAIDVRIGRLSAALSGWAKDQGLRLFTYTCNGPRQVQKALHLGVDAILSDRPCWLTAYLGE
jgi:glycerophosphoryl diester phosphodiesterase